MGDLPALQEHWRLAVDSLQQSRSKMQVFWLVCLGVVVANAAVFRRRAARYSAGNAPALAVARGIVNAFVI